MAGGIPTPVKSSLSVQHSPELQMGSTICSQPNSKASSSIRRKIGSMMRRKMSNMVIQEPCHRVGQ